MSCFLLKFGFKKSNTKPYVKAQHSWMNRKGGTNLLLRVNHEKVLKPIHPKILGNVESCRILNITWSYTHTFPHAELVSIRHGTGVCILHHHLDIAKSLRSQSPQQHRTRHLAPFTGQTVIYVPTDYFSLVSKTVCLPKTTKLCGFSERNPTDRKGKQSQIILQKSSDYSTFSWFTSVE